MQPDHTTRFQIRPALPDDWETIVEFNCRLAEESEDKRLDPETITAGVKAVLADRNKGRYFVACLEDRIVGQLMHTWEYSDWRNGEIWWLQSVYVHPEFRRQGVFRLLYDKLHNEAVSSSEVVGLRLYVENDNDRALQTYCNLGMKPGGYHVLEQLFEK